MIPHVILLDSTCTEQAISNRPRDWQITSHCTDQENNIFLPVVRVDKEMKIGWIHVIDNMLAVSMNKVGVVVNLFLR